MEGLECQMCQDRFKGGVGEYVYHLQYAHGVTINRGLGDLNFRCPKNGCERQFNLFSSLRKHLTNFHVGDIDRNIIENVDNVAGVNEVFDRNYVKDINNINENYDYKDRENKNEQELPEMNLRLSVVVT